MRDELLAEARTRIQQAGVSGFSYGDLASTLGIKAPSIHHHFPRKDDLVAEVAARYRAEFAEAVEAIASAEPAADAASSDRIRAYARLFATTAAADLQCLCGAISADWVAVGEQTRAEVTGFFAEQADWLRGQLAAGVAGGEFRSDVDPARQATLLLTALEGAIVLSRAGDRADLASRVADDHLSLLTPTIGG
ncbi:MAG: TetR/AcrR family transcriptional regulator [Actinomycetota bacterium]